MKNNILKLLYIPFLFLFCFNIALAQTSPLSKKVSLKVVNQPIEKVLNTISSLGKVNFSYNSDIIPLDSLVSLQVSQVEISKILSKLFADRFTYKTTGQYIIIQKKKSTQVIAANKQVNVKGSVVESGTGNKIANVSVYNINGKEEILTDTNGNFSLSFSPKDENISLAINNENFLDTIVFVNSDDTIDIALKPKMTVDTSFHKDSLRVEQNNIVSSIINNDLITHARNIGFYKERLFQVSFLPFAGTNYKLSGSITNKISLNILAGYAYGLNGVEVGGYLNINRKYVHGVQIAGWGNFTGKTTEGIQIAGFFNHNLGSVKGIQIAGFYNVVKDTIDGVQIAGFTNILNGKLYGVQIAGFSNVTTKNATATQVAGFMNLALKNSSGIQTAGFANITIGDENGVQVAGFSNIVNGNTIGSQTAGFTNITTNDMNGVQVSGFANIANGNTNGIQVAGFSNIAKQDINGIQISGFLNYGKTVKGIQIGFINIADSVSGVSIGILNFIKKGIHQFSVYSNELGSANIQYVFGSHHFYSILGFSAYVSSNPKSWGIEYGLGTQFLSQKKVNLNVSITATDFNIGYSWNLDQSSLYKLSTDVSAKISNHISVFGGPTYSLFQYDKSRQNMSNFPQNYIFSKSSQTTVGNSVLKTWIGLRLGLSYNL